MRKIILVISTQYPGFGGSSTNAYAIVKYLRTYGYHAVGIFVDDNTSVEYDPDKIGEIYRFSLYPFICRVKMKILEYRYFLHDKLQALPSLILCKNYVAPICSKLLYPTIKNIYLVSGLSNIIDICQSIPASLILSEKKIIPKSEKEIVAINHSDIIVLNSPLSFELFVQCYPEHQKKIYQKIVDTSQYITTMVNKVEITCPKIYDFIIVASNLTRVVKNNLFLVNILKRPIYRRYTKIVIGNDNDGFKNIPNTITFDLLPHNVLMDYMRSSRVLLYPSLYDSNPNTIREAVENHCLVLMSNNVGYCDVFPKYSVCQSYQELEWIKKSIYLAKHYYRIIPKYHIDFGSKKEDIVELINYALCQK